MWIIYVICRPWSFSPLKNVPGPPLRDGHILWGHYPNILRSQAGVEQRRWTQTFGAVVRVVGPLGFERLIFTSIPALRAILADKHRCFDKVEYL